SITGGAGSIVGGLVGVNSGPSSVPALPGVGGCEQPICNALTNASASSGPGSIANSQASGNISRGLRRNPGGLAGQNPGTSTGPKASGNVTGTALSATAGGLVGENSGSVSGSSASGAVSVNAAAFAFAGGLVGQNDAAGTIANSSASGNVTGTGQN